MGLKCGIVGLPNVGKSTLFNALTSVGALAANYPFATKEPNIGMIVVPDERLDQLAALINPRNVLPTNVEILDIAGLIKGASKGEGLGNQFLANIRETDAIAHVVRCFLDDNIIHVSNKVSPQNDIETINTELALADLQTIEKALLKAAKNAKSGDKQTLLLKQTLEKVVPFLNEGNAVRAFALSEEELDLISERSKRRGFWRERGQAAKVWKTAQTDWVEGMRSNCKLVLFVECKNDFETRYMSGARGIDRATQFDRLNRLLKGEDYLIDLK